MTASVFVISLSNLSTDVASGGIVRLVNIFKRINDQIDLTIICTNLGEKAYSKELSANYWMLKRGVKDNITSSLRAVILYAELAIRAYLLNAQVANSNSSSVVVYAGSTYLPDAVAAVKLKKKLHGSKYVQLVHHIVPGPLKRKGNFFSNTIAYVDQQVSLFLAKRYADKIIVVNPEVKEFLNARGFKNRVELNYNGVDLTKVRNTHTGTIKYDCAFIGRIDPNKGIIDLVKIMKIIISKRPSTKFIIVGGGIDSNIRWLDEEVKLNNLSKNVILTGRLDDYGDVLKVMKESKVLAFPTREEGFGIVIVEALACSCVPVVWNLRVFDKLFPVVCRIDPYNYGMFAEKIIDLCDNEESRRVLLENGKTLLHIYDWDVIAEKEYNIISSFG